MAMRFRAHETFFIRKGWLSKGMKHIVEKPGLFVDKTENPMDILGIGSNMVKSLRYWLQTVGLTKEPKKGKRDQTLTDFGKEVFKHDCFIEEIGTLYLLQYKLATNKEEASAWYHFFNIFSMSELTREDFVKEIQKYMKIEGEADVALRSLNDDFNCIVNTYLPRYKTNAKRVSPENNIDCPLGEMGLIDILNKDKKTYKKTTPSMAKIAEIINGDQERTFDLLREPIGLYLQVKIHDVKRKNRSRILRIAISDVLYQIWTKMTPTEKKALCTEIDKLKKSDMKIA